MNRTGTHHFESEATARRYYGEDIAEKIVDGSIVIGAPAPWPGHRVTLNKEEGRYFQEEVYTRAQYMAFKNSEEMHANHRRFYAEVAAETNARALVLPLIPRCIEALKVGDDAFNEAVPLAEWDRLTHRLSGDGKALRDRGDYPTLGNGVCILKEAARLECEARMSSKEG